MPPFLLVSENRMRLAGGCGRFHGLGGCGFPRHFNPMKTNQLLSAALAMATLASTAFGARFYVQPAVAFSEMADSKATAGPSLALGLTFAGKHSLEVEGIVLDTEGRYDSDFKFKATPVLINYRYEFPVSGKLTGSAGLSAGMIHEEAEYTYTYFNYYYYYGYGLPGPFTYHYEAKDDVFAGGFHLGLNYRMNDHFALMLGGKALYSGESEIRERSATLIFQLGLNCRF